MGLASFFSLIGFGVWIVGVLFLARDVFQNNLSPIAAALLVSGFAVQVTSQLSGEVVCLPPIAGGRPGSAQRSIKTD
jgi:heme/copper-type cytochrome/quinol oxidase subunit 1